jgi:uncharacterized membrane protein
VAEQAQALPGRPYPPPGLAEPVWPAQATVVGAIVLQLTLPGRLTAGPVWLLPSLEAVLLVGLGIASPAQLQREHTRRRQIALGLTALITAANVYSLIELSRELLHHQVKNGYGLIIGGMQIWLTNFLIFALWYWEMDRGGPGARAAGHDGSPDFLFPQMNDDRVLEPSWRPRFIDYLYLALTNATAFSPTDAMPLTRSAKAMMTTQSMVSLVTIVLVVSRAVNIL